MDLIARFSPSTELNMKREGIILAIIGVASFLFLVIILEIGLADPRKIS